MQFECDEYLMVACGSDVTSAFHIQFDPYSVHRGLPRANKIHRKYISSAVHPIVYLIDVHCHPNKWQHSRGYGCRQSFCLFSFNYFGRCVNRDRLRRAVRVINLNGYRHNNGRETVRNRSQHRRSNYIDQIENTVSAKYRRSAENGTKSK